MPAEAPIRHALGKPVFQSETEGLREGGLSRKKPPAFGHQKRPRFRVFGVAAFLGMSLRQYSLARQEPENGEIPREEQRKEENEVPAFSIGSRSKPVDESLYPGKKETGRYDSDNAGIEKFHALHSLEWEMSFSMSTLNRGGLSSRVSPCACLNSGFLPALFLPSL